MNYPCLGHQGRCKFCKSEWGAPRSVGGMPEVDHITGKRKVDPCCKACANNLKRQKKFYERTSIS